MPHLFALVVFVLVGSLFGQGWVDRTGPNGPAPRYGHAMCYDPVHGYTLMVGGTGIFSPVFGETWTWNGSSWTNRGTAPITTGNNFRYAQSTGAMCAMAFHPLTNTVVMVAKPDIYNQTNSGQIMGHIWTGAGWSSGVSTGLWYNGGSAAELTMAYDSTRQELVVWSSDTPYQVAIGDGVSWTLRTALVSPSPLGGRVCAAWDATIGRIVMTNGSWFYEWTGMAWYQRWPSAAPGLAAITSDSTHQRIVLLGPASAPNQTWIVNNGNCQRLTTAVEPPPRNASALAFDSARGVCVLFGGTNGYSMGDTWEFDLGPLASFTTYGTGCAGSHGTPSITAQGTSIPRTGTTFTAQINNLPLTGPAFLTLGLSDTNYGGIPLPFNLNALGAPGCTLLTSCEELHLLTNVLGSAQWSFTVPPVPGASFYTQVFPLDSVNALGLTASNGGHGVIGL